MGGQEAVVGAPTTGTGLCDYCCRCSHILLVCRHTYAASGGLPIMSMSDPDKEVTLADLLAEYDPAVLRQWLREQEQQEQQQTLPDKPPTNEE